jgi:pimeloyl-ACP methyl ester carboxylesterase
VNVYSTSSGKTARRSAMRTVLAFAGTAVAAAALVAYTSFGPAPAVKNASAESRTPDATTANRTYELYDGLKITVDKRGARDGTAVLVLHGGGGPRSVAGLSAAMSQHAYVITPTHPGFDGTPRPDWTDSMTDLAVAYLDLIEKLDVQHVLVVGSSFGGWIASEMALHDTRGRISGLILLDGVGIAPKPPLQIADPAKLGPVKTGELAFFNPALRPNPATLTDAQKAAAAANLRTTGVYAGPTLTDPKLQRRLHRVTAPVLVLAGEEDGIAPLPYERAFAASFPHATFRPIPQAGHFPHIEQPALVSAAITEFVNTQIKPGGKDK